MSAPKPIRTFRQFLTQLRSFKGQFRLDRDGWLRTRPSIQGLALITCPISAVCNKLHGTAFVCDVTDPAVRMGMGKRMAYDIAGAADTPKRDLRGMPIRRNYRARMLRALKIREVA